MFCLGQNLSVRGGWCPDTPGRMRSATLHGAMGRPLIKIKRERQLNVALTLAEHELVLARAARAGMRPVDYGRARLLGAANRPLGSGAPAPHLDPLLLATLSRLGNNLNQIARRLNTLDLPAPASLEPLLQLVRSLIVKAGGP